MCVCVVWFHGGVSGVCWVHGKVLPASCPLSLLCRTLRDLGVPENWVAVWLNLVYVLGTVSYRRPSPGCYTSILDSTCMHLISIPILIICGYHGNVVYYHACTPSPFPLWFASFPLPFLHCLQPLFMYSDWQMTVWHVFFPFWVNWNFQNVAWHREYSVHYSSQLIAILCVHLANVNDKGDVFSKNQNKQLILKVSLKSDTDVV